MHPKHVIYSEARSSTNEILYYYYITLYQELKAYTYRVHKTEILKFKPILAPSGLAPGDICTLCPLATHLNLYPSRTVYYTCIYSPTQVFVKLLETSKLQVRNNYLLLRLQCSIVAASGIVLQKK